MTTFLEFLRYLTELVVEILGRFPKKTPTEKIEDGKEEIEKGVEEEKKTGRPKWD